MSNDFWSVDFNNFDFLTSPAMTVPRAYLFGDVPVLGPIGVAVNSISSAAVVAIGPDPTRHGILFHNPNVSGPVLRIFPTGIPLSSGQGGIPIAPLGFFEIYDSDGGNTTDRNSLMRCNVAWQVVADSSGSWGLTIWNFTDDNPEAFANNTLPPPVAYQNYDVDIVSPSESTGVNVSTLTTSSVQIMAANQNRRGLMMGNPGSTYNKAFAPGNIGASIGAGSIVLGPQTQKTIQAVGKVRINCAINACTANSSDGTVTALEFI